MAINPFELLTEVFKIDEIAAVHIADKWGGPSATPEQCNAAWFFAQRQTVFPVCIDCRWPVLPDNPHDICNDNLRRLREEEAEVIDDNPSCMSCFDVGCAKCDPHWYDCDDDDEIDAASLAEIEFGRKHEMYNN